MILRVFNSNKRNNDLLEPERENVRSISAQVRGEISVTHPVFDLVNYNDYFKYNMLFVPVWDNRYYFVDDVTIDGNHTYLHCTEDYLASWYDDIMASTFYCVRSYSDPTEGLTDTIFPVKNPANTFSTNLANPWTNLRGGNYVIAISSGGNSSPHIGTNAYYILDQSEMTDFMNDLMGKAELSFSGIADSIAKAMVNPMQYIRSCMWFPLEITANTRDVSSISFGWWSSDADAKVINMRSNSDTYTKIELVFEYDERMFQHDDYVYQAFPPYSRYTITAYPFGVIDVPPAVISNFINMQYEITLEIYIDSITGMGTLLILSGDMEVPFYVSTAQIGVSIPVGQVLQDYAGALLDTAGSVSQLFSGHVVGAASGIYSALDSLAPEVTVSGASGGFAQLMLDNPWCLKREYWQAEVYDDFLGRPCCKNKLVSDLTGYAEFANVDIMGIMYDSEKQAIKTLLESGIFIGKGE